MKNKPNKLTDLSQLSGLITMDQVSPKDQQEHVFIIETKDLPTTKTPKRQAKTIMDITEDFSNDANE